MRSLIAKLTRPRFAEVILRQRLFQELDRAAGKKIVWIAAPAGSGKSALTASWLDARKLPCIWYQADAGDADVASFFSSLNSAAGQAAPRFRTPLPRFTPEYSFGIPAFTKRYFDGLYARLKPPFRVVIDNYQDVPAETPFHDVIRDGIEACPDGISFVIMSRSEPPPALVPLIMDNSMTVLRRDAVRFTLEESCDLLVSRGKQCGNPNVLKALHRLTDGWAAGLVLLAESAVMHDGVPDVKRISRKQVFEFFAQQLFDRTDDETRSFLMMTAFLPSVDPATAKALTGLGKAARILASLAERNLFTTEHAHLSSSYQYHPLFRDYLIAKARIAYSEAELQQLMQRAADLLSDDGRKEDAIRLCLMSGAWDKAADLISSCAPVLIAQGRGEIVRTWISVIPPETQVRSPYLLYWHGCSLQMRTPAQARTQFEQGFLRFQSAGDLTGMLLCLCAAADTAIHEQEYVRLDPLIDLLLDLYGQRKTSLLPDIETRVTMSTFNALALRRPEHPQIDVWASGVYAIVSDARDIDVNVRLQTGVYLVVYLCWQGLFAKAETVLLVLENCARERHASDLLVITVRNMRALYGYFSADHAKVTPVPDILRMADETGVHIWDHHLLVLGMSLALSSGDHAAASGFTAGMDRIIETARRFDRGYYYFICAWKALLEGDLMKAFELVTYCVDRSPDVGFKGPMAAAHLGMAEVLHEQGNEDGAHAHLAAAYSIADAMKSHFLLYMCSLAEAYFAIDTNEKASSDRLRTAFGIGSAFRYMNLLWWRPQVMARLCGKALEEGIETDYVRELVRRRGLAPDARQLHLETWPWPIRIRTLGGFEVFRDDKPVLFPGRVQQKPLALLKAIIAFGCRGVNQEKIIDALWPEADGDVAKASFDTTMHRLRKLLQCDDAIVLRDGMITIDERYCWVDACSFEACLRTAEEARNSEHQRAGGPARNTSQQPLEKAISSYKGHFLPGDAQHPWTISLRERLHAKFLNNTVILGSSWAETGRYDKAAAVFEKGLEIDDLSEELYQHLMVCRHQMGQNAEAIRTYDRCRAVLKASLGIKPSPKTESIYYAIRQEG